MNYDKHYTLSNQNLRDIVQFDLPHQNTTVSLYLFTDQN